MHPGWLRISAPLAAFALTFVAVAAQGVTKETVAGISTFARLDTTIACGGATSVDAVPELKQMGSDRSSTCAARVKPGQMSMRKVLPRRRQA
jgi:hypothetical protein